MSGLDPLDTLYEAQQGADLLIPQALASLYGRLQFPTHVSQPYVIGNFVTTLDGVVALNDSDQSGGGQISGFNQQDQVAGRDDSVERPGLVALKQFAPEHPVWGTLVGVKRGRRYLFLRYAFEARG
jgi:hypothetical protein